MPEEAAAAGLMPAAAARRADRLSEVPGRGALRDELITRSEWGIERILKMNRTVSHQLPEELVPSGGYGAVLDIRSLTIRYVVDEAVRTAVANVSLSVPDGGFVSLVGPSGCGKSTLLHAAAGLIRASEGTVTYLGREWTGLHPNVGYVTQKDTLLPWRNVRDNIGLPLEFQGVKRGERRAMAEAMAENVGLQESLRLFPGELSGGMRQRVQLGRTFISRPKLLLMDEPFGALDAYMRLKMQELLLSILKERRISTLFVTHDLTEAISLSNQVIALRGTPGRVGVVSTIDFLPDRSDLMSLRGHPLFNQREEELWRCISTSMEVKR